MPNSKPKPKAIPKPTVVCKAQAIRLPLDVAGEKSATPWVFEIIDARTGKALFRPETKRKDPKTGILLAHPGKRFATRHAAERTAGRYIQRFKKTGRFE